MDSVDAESFYAKNRPPSERIRRHDQYERYIADEVVPFVRSRARTGGRIGTLGASFGAYHAVNFGLRHPELCDKVVGLSGKYDIYSFLDGYWDDLCYFHCPTANVPNMDSEWVWKLNSMDICIVTGRDRQHPRGLQDDDRHPLREGHPPPRRHLVGAVRPRLAVVEGADPQLRAVAQAKEKKRPPETEPAALGAWQNHALLLGPEARP